MELQTVAESVELAATPDEVWSLIGQFGGTWHPLTARVRLTGTGIGQLRTIQTLDGREIVERLEAIDDAKRLCEELSDSVRLAFSDEAFSPIERIEEARTNLSTALRDAGSTATAS